MHPMYLDVKIEDVQHCRWQMKWPILFFWPFVFLWACPLVVHPRKDGAIQQQNQGRGDRATWIQSCQLVLFPCLAYWPAMRTCCFWGRFQLFFPKQCVHTMGFLQQGLGVKGRVWLRVRIVVCGFWPRSFAQKNPLRSSMFLSTVQARTKWGHQFPPIRRSPLSDVLRPFLELCRFFVTGPRDSGLLEGQSLVWHGPRRTLVTFSFSWDVQCFVHVPKILEGAGRNQRCRRRTNLLLAGPVSGDFVTVFTFGFRTRWSFCLASAVLWIPQAHFSWQQQNLRELDERVFETKVKHNVSHFQLWGGGLYMVKF